MHAVSPIRPEPEPVWLPLSPRQRAALRDRIARALTPLLYGPDAVEVGLELADKLGDGRTRNAFAVVAAQLSDPAFPEVPPELTGAVVGIYLSQAADPGDQRDSDELLGDAGVHAELIPAVLEELRSIRAEGRRG